MSMKKNLAGLALAALLNGAAQATPMDAPAMPDPNTAIPTTDNEGIAPFQPEKIKSFRAEVGGHWNDKIAVEKDEDGVPVTYNGRLVQKELAETRTVTANSAVANIIGSGAAGIKPLSKTQVEQLNAAVASSGAKFQHAVIANQKILAIGEGNVGSPNANACGSFDASGGGQISNGSSACTLNTSQLDMGNGMQMTMTQPKNGAALAVAGLDANAIAAMVGGQGGKQVQTGTVSIKTGDTTPDGNTPNGGQPTGTNPDDATTPTAGIPDDVLALLPESVRDLVKPTKDGKPGDDATGNPSVKDLVDDLLKDIPTNPVTGLPGTPGIGIGTPGTPGTTTGGTPVTTTPDPDQIQKEVEKLIVDLTDTGIGPGTPGTPGIGIGTPGTTGTGVVTCTDGTLVHNADGSTSCVDKDHDEDHEHVTLNCPPGTVGDWPDCKETHTVPEPETGGLFLMGAFAWALSRRRSAGASTDASAEAGVKSAPRGPKMG